MPSTINGIGTMYYGKSNVRSRRGVCEKCHREVQLESYETGLYFTLVFIPLIPLGRKQVIDYCPSCTQHRATSLQQWQELQQTATRDAVRQADTDPDDPDANMQLLGTLAALQRDDEALRLAETIGTKFAGNADVQLALGVWHDENGREEPSHACFSRALELQPDNPGVRRAVAIGCMERGELDRARELLDFMLESGSDREPGVLLMLADAYQSQGADAEALALYEMALDSSPQLGRDKALRQRIAAAEEAVGSETTILPELPWRPSRWTVVWAVATLIAVAVIGTNYYMQTHQTVYLINRLDAPVTFTIDDQPARTIGNTGLEKITLAEGKHRAVATGPNGGEEAIDFEVTNGFFERFAGKSAFVVNFGGAATLIWEKTYYSAVPDPDAEIPYQIHFGETFFAYRNIDYMFCEFPHELKTESRHLTKTRVAVLDFPPLAILQGFPDDTSEEEKLRFIQHELPRHGNDEQLLWIYRIFATQLGKIAECRSFLGEGLRRRPVEIEWHRMYQELCKADGDETRLVTQYDDMLRQEPGNSALLYLRGRIATGTRSSEAYFDRAVEADPENSYPLLAKGYQRVARGDFAGAVELLTRARQLNPDSLSMQGLLFEARLGTRQYADLKTELNESRQEFPLDLDAQQKLLQVLVAEGDADGAEEANANYVRQAEREQQPALAARSQMTLDYLLGRLEEYRNDIARFRELDGIDEEGSLDFSAYVELGDLAAAEKLIDSGAVSGEGHLALILSLAWNQKGDREGSAQWRQKAIEAFESAAGDEKLIAALLAQGDEVRMEDVDDVSTARSTMAVVLAALAEQSPTLRDQLLQRAEKLNLVGTFPYQFLRRTIEAVQRSEVEP